MNCKAVFTGLTIDEYNNSESKNIRAQNKKWKLVSHSVLNTTYHWLFCATNLFGHMLESVK